MVGSLAGEWMSVQNKLSDANAFLWGHQGYEYVDLGRGWQILLFVGLLIWLFLVVRATLPALKVNGEHRSLLYLFLLSAGAIGLFYGAGLTWGQHTHLTIVEYWRWWVVHLWVEGFFEVFATTVIAFFFTRLGLIRPAFAAKSALLSATIFLSGGIIGTCHHLYFSGTPTVALAWGSVFSALEVVPLTMVAYSAMDDLRNGRLAPWVQRYKWAIYFFVAVAFWNMVGAGSVRVHDQPADRPLLHARPQHHAAARPRRSVRGLRHAGYRADAGLPARHGTSRRMERGMAPVRLLGNECRPLDHVCRKPAPGWAWLRPGPPSKRATGMRAAPNSSGCLTCRLSAGCASRGTRYSPSRALVLVAFVFVGRSGSASASEEPLPDAVRVPAGD